MFDTRMDLAMLKAHLWDYLIELKESSAKDNSTLYVEEQEKLQENMSRQYDHIEVWLMF